MAVRLTEYSHGAGCGCKISPKVLKEILHTENGTNTFEDLLIGNDTMDDAAVFAIDEEQAIISTTDFFTPIVDDPFDFGAIASVNAISDVYAMGGKPLMAISILGWPVDLLPPETAKQVVDGARDVCARAGIPLAGGHSIDAREPIFGLAVTGIIKRDRIKSNDRAKPGCELYLTKPLGVGIVTTAQKKKIVDPVDFQRAVDQMLKLNDFGTVLGNFPGVLAMTDVTGFGLLGHLIEICEASNVSAELEYAKVPVLPSLENYIQQNAVPGGTHRNFKSYGHKVSSVTDTQKVILCDPQTSGGLLIAVDPREGDNFRRLLLENGMDISPIGKITARGKQVIQLK